MSKQYTLGQVIDMIKPGMKVKLSNDAGQGLYCDSFGSITYWPSGNVMVPFAWRRAAYEIVETELTAEEAFKRLVFDKKPVKHVSESVGLQTTVEKILHPFSTVDVDSFRTGKFYAYEDDADDF
jgi:hypothetical protein